MADNQTTVAINIGSQRIGMAVFEAGKGGLVLKSYGSETIVADPALDASRVSQARVAISDLAKRLKVKGKARYAISGQAVLTRFVKLPPIQQDNIEQLVTFEAQQQIPFPLSEVVWDYELVDGVQDKEAVIVAIKSDALDEINAAVNDSGLGTAEVDASPMALYNAFRAAYGNPTEPILIADIGAKVTNLLYVQGKRFFVRSVPVGGVSITSAIAKDYGASFMDAEHQKVSNGLVALAGGHTEQLEEGVASLAMVIRNAMTRLQAQIAQTTTNYRSNYGGNAPTKVLLAGGGANLPYTLEFFQEKLGIPVEYFNPLKNVTIGKGVDTQTVQNEGHMMGELIGLGLRGIGKSAVNIDLVPRVVEQARAADRKKPFLIGAAAVLLGGVGAWAASQFVAAGKGVEKLNSITEQRDGLQPYKDAISGLLKKENDTRTIVSGYTSAEADRAYWSDLLFELRNALASDAVWITDLEPIANYDPSATGAATPNARPDPKFKSGNPLVKNEFTNINYGASALNDVKVEMPATGSKKAATTAAPAAKANAIRVRGFWRQSPKGQGLVSELFKSLQEKSTKFNFQMKDAKGQLVPIPDSKLLKDITVSGDEGEIGLPFEVTIPLAREVSVK